MAGGERWVELVDGHGRVAVSYGRLVNARHDTRGWVFVWALSRLDFGEELLWSCLPFGKWAPRVDCLDGPCVHIVGRLEGR